VKVDVVQYMLPNGRKEGRQVEIRDSFEAPYNAITMRGWRVAAECLTTGEVSITVEDDEQDFATELVANGPDVPRAVERAIARAIAKAICTPPLEAAR